MKLAATDIARMIDVSAVRAPHGEAEIRELVQHSQQYPFAAVHALPCWVPLLKELLAGSTSTRIGAPVGFPSGAHRTEIKLAEAQLLLADGVEEMDLMLNVGMLRSGRQQYVEDEIRAVVQTAGSIPVKVILEVCYLTPDEIKRACESCIRASAAFIKTSTGWAPSGATLEVVTLITSFVGGAIQVKAAGGIRDLDTLLKMHRMGVSRFGINLPASLEILRTVAALPGGVVDV
jgi:deoxyribose-phosphate aldolase